MSIRRPIIDTVCDFQLNEIGHFCLYPSKSRVFPLNTEFRITSIVNKIIQCLSDLCKRRQVTLPSMTLQNEVRALWNFKKYIVFTGHRMMSKKLISLNILNNIEILYIKHVKHIFYILMSFKILVSKAGRDNYLIKVSKLLHTDISHHCII